MMILFAHGNAKRSDRTDVRKAACSFTCIWPSLAVQMRVRSRESGCRQRSEEISHLWMRTRRAPQKATDDPWGVPQEPVLFELEQYSTALLQSSQSGLSHLWRPWHPGVRSMAQQLRGLRRGYGARMGARPDHRPYRYQRPLRTRKLSLGAHVGASQEPASSLRMEKCSGASEREVRSF